MYLIYLILFPLHNLFSQKGGGRIFALSLFCLDAEVSKEKRGERGDVEKAGQDPSSPFFPYIRGWFWAYEDRNSGTLFMKHGTRLSPWNTASLRENKISTGLRRSHASPLTALSSGFRVISGSGVPLGAGDNVLQKPQLQRIKRKEHEQIHSWTHIRRHHLEDTQK